MKNHPEFSFLPETSLAPLFQIVSTRFDIRSYIIFHAAVKFAQNKLKFAYAVFGNANTREKYYTLCCQRDDEKATYKFSPCFIDFVLNICRVYESTTRRDAK